jgi:hypothetical protein
MQDHPPPGHEQPAEQPSQPAQPSQPSQPSMTPVANPPRPVAPSNNASTQVGQTANRENAGMDSKADVAQGPAPARGVREWTVTREKTKCSSMVKVHCPEGAMCNPPPPAKYTCPKFMADGDRIDVIQRTEKAECFVDYGEPSCPPGSSCNPPRPQKVACPK